MTSFPGVPRTVSPRAEPTMVARLPSHQPDAATAGLAETATRRRADAMVTPIRLAAGRNRTREIVTGVRGRRPLTDALPRTESVLPRRLLRPGDGARRGRERPDRT